MAEVQPGDRVAEYEPGYMGVGTARITTVERLTATQVITATGNRYRRDGCAVGTGRARLLSPDAPEVRRAIITAVVSRLRHNLDRLFAEGANTDPVALLDQAAARIRAARLRITELDAPEGN